MKRIFSYITTCTLAATVLAGCAKSTGTDGENGGGEGSLTFDVTFDGGKAEGTRAAAPADCVVKIANADGYLYIYESLADVPDKLWLVSGAYSITVEGGTRDGDAWTRYGFDVPYYKGTADFTIVEGENTPVVVDCPIRNTLFAVTFAPTVTGKLTGYTLTLYPDPADEEVTLVFDAENPGAVGYVMLADGQTTVDWSFAATHADRGDAIAKSGTLTVQPGKRYDFTFKYTELFGTLGDIVFTVEEAVPVTHPILIPSTPPSTVAPVVQGDVWATHATLSGVVGTAAESGIEFAYRAAGGEWQYVAVTGTEAGRYSTTLTGLAPGTAYEATLRIDGAMVEADYVGFTTEAAPQLPNAGLENWSTNNVPYPYNPGEAWWGTGNNRVFNLINVIMTTPVEGRTPGTQAAQLASQKPAALKALGAGNLFTGTFYLNGTDGEVTFGRPFTARPSAMKVWYKAAPGTVDAWNATCPDPEIVSGVTDKYQIYIALVDGNFPHTINTGNTGSFINYATDERVIAYGELVNTETVTDWTQISIPLNYRSLTRIPTHIVIVASSNMYGDYFTGSTTSKLWVDDFELVYDENIIEQQ